MKIISKRSTETVTEYRHEFGQKGEVHFSFDCDRDGQPSGLAECAQKNWTLCTTSGEYEDMGVKRYDWRVTNHAIGKCECGGEVHLTSFTNTCNCGRDYNMSGQILAPRHFWGEETGEHWTECI